MKWGIPTQHTQTRRYAKRDIVFAQGDAERSVLFLEDGAVSLTMVSPIGKEVMMGLLGEGDIFGESCLNGSSARPMTARVATATAIISSVRANIANRLMHDNPAFAETITKGLLRRLEKLEAAHIDQLFNTAEKRLARTLLQLADYRVDRIDVVHDKGRHVERISQDDLAELVGTTRSRINFFMRKFTKEGHLDYKMRSDITVKASLVGVLIDSVAFKSTQK